MTAEVVERYKELLRNLGYVVLKETSYRRAQERQRVAEVMRAYAEERVQDNREWAVTALNEQRRLSDRLTFVYGIARAHGATVEELSGKQTWPTEKNEPPRRRAEIDDDEVDLPGEQRPDPPEV